MTTSKINVVAPLKACPFCGNEDVKGDVQGPYPPEITQVATVRCKECRAEIAASGPDGDPFPRISARWNRRAVAPVPLLLFCPECMDRHVDVGEFATKPHHTHACQSCGFVWRPAVVDTVGVLFLPGFKNEESQ